MNSQPVAPPPVKRAVAKLADAADLRSAVCASLARVPIDDRALRRDVWTLVVTERDTGASPGRIMMTLTDLVDEAAFSPASVRRSRLHQVMLWCVEAYFGHLGGDALRPDAHLPSLPPRASNR